MRPLTRSRTAFVSLLETGDWGASEYLWSETAARLVDEGGEVLACVHGRALRPTALETLAARGVRLLERYPKRGHRLRALLNEWQGKAVNPVLEASLHELVRFRPDLVLISAPWIGSPGTHIFANRLLAAGIPYALLFHTHAGHNWPADSWADALAQICRRAAAVFFVSEDNRRLLVRQIGLPDDFGAVVRNPLAIGRDFAPPWPDDAITRIACVGRLEAGQKGQDLLIECLHDPAWENRPVAFDFFGEGPCRQSLERLASPLPPGRVNFRGHTKHPGEIWATHHLLVLPSRFEGLGLVVAEAQLCGRPVVITDCAARELVIDGRTGFIARGCSVAALNEALARAWAARTAWPELGAAARQHMLKLLPADPVAAFATRLQSLVSVSRPAAE